MSRFTSRLKQIVQLKIYAPHYPFLRKVFGKRSFKLLDVGCGTTSVLLFKKIFPSIEYHGIDYQNPGVTETLTSSMHAYYEKNLNLLQFHDIPDHYFDCIVMSHVLEHLNHPIEVLTALIPKLKTQGCVLIEYPSAQSVNIVSSSKLPFVTGTLNFYDDHTHVAPCDTKLVIAELIKHGFKIVENKIRRNFFFMVISPVIMPIRMIKNNYKFKASDLWDFVGFAELVYAKRD